MPVGQTSKTCIYPTSAKRPGWCRFLIAPYNAPHSLSATAPPPSQPLDLAAACSPSWTQLSFFHLLLARYQLPLPPPPDDDPPPNELLLELLLDQLLLELLLLDHESLLFSSTRGRITVSVCV